MCWSPYCCQNSSLICNKLRCTVYSDTFLSEPALTSTGFKQTSTSAKLGGCKRKQRQIQTLQLITSYLLYVPLFHVHTGFHYPMQWGVTSDIMGANSVIITGRNKSPNYKNNGLFPLLDCTCVPLLWRRLEICLRACRDTGFMERIISEGRISLSRDREREAEV